MQIQAYNNQFSYAYFSLYARYHFHFPIINCQHFSTALKPIKVQFPIFAPYGNYRSLPAVFQFP
jgi:hypothetical protein